MSPPDHHEKNPISICECLESWLLEYWRSLKMSIDCQDLLANSADGSFIDFHGQDQYQ